MRVLHPIGRISTLNRSNMILLRQIESACLLSLAHASHNCHMSGMTNPDPTLAQIAAQFARLDVEWSRGAYMIIDRRTANPIATAASHSGYRSLRAFLLVKRQGAVDDLRKSWPYEAHAR
jgi:hypothetical protein